MMQESDFNTKQDFLNHKKNLKKFFYNEGLIAKMINLNVLALVKEFREYIKNGQPREYSGLYSPHWGYPEKEMEVIRKKAIELGYIKKDNG